MKVLLTAHERELILARLHLTSFVRQVLSNAASQREQVTIELTFDELEDLREQCMQLFMTEGREANDEPTGFGVMVDELVAKFAAAQ